MLADTGQRAALTNMSMGKKSGIWLSFIIVGVHKPRMLTGVVLPLIARNCCAWMAVVIGHTKYDASKGQRQGTKDTLSLFIVHRKLGRKNLEDSRKNPKALPVHVQCQIVWPV